jgi:nucleoside-diphosphate-sugar epimerase
MEKDRLNGARVLIAGGMSDLGKLVAAELGAQGATCYPVSRRAGFDLRNEPEALTAALHAKPDIIVHAAADSSVGKAVGQVFRDNLAMGTNLVHAAAVAKAHLVVLASHHAYGRGHGKMFEEKDFWTGNTIGALAPLGSAQRAVEAMCRFYRAQYGLRCAFLVAPMIYGREPMGRNPVDEIVTDVALALDTGKLAKDLPGGADQPLSFLHVSDAARAIAAVAGTLDDGPLNLASEHSYTFSDVARTAAAACGLPESELRYGKIPDDHYRALDGRRMKAATGWVPQVDFHVGVAAQAKGLREMMECDPARAEGAAK